MPEHPDHPSREFVPRHTEARLREALTDTRVVLLLGARQTGKSTLARHLAAGSFGAGTVTLDDVSSLAAAKDDPVGFVASLERPVVIDEVQRSPELLLAIKELVDRDPAPGQFLLTGSANLLTAPKINETRTGRTEIVHLWRCCGRPSPDQPLDVACIPRSAPAA